MINKKHSIRRISIYAFSIFFLGIILSGFFVYFFINKGIKLNNEYAFYNTAVEKVSSYKHFTEDLLTSPNLPKAKKNWLESKSLIKSYINHSLIVDVLEDETILNYWKIIDYESNEIHKQLKNQYFQSDKLMEKGILRRLGEECYLNIDSDLYLELLSFKNKIDFLLQNEVFLLNELNDLKTNQQQILFTQIEYTKKIGILHVLITLFLTILITGFIIKLISKTENELLLTKNNLQIQLAKELNIVDKYVSISTTDTEGIITYVSSAFCNTSGFSKDELIGKRHNIIASKETPLEIYKDLWEGIINTGEWAGELQNKTKNGNIYWVAINISSIKDPKGMVIGYIAYSENITNSKQLYDLSITDELTALHNRRYFEEIAPPLIHAAKRNKALITFVMLDIDFFKQYNDSYGHQAGDNALKQVSDILRNSINRSSDYSFRLGGEEFGLLYHINDENDAVKIAENVRKNIADLKIEHNKSSVSDVLTISVGVYVVYPDDKSSFKIIYKSADDALYAAKRGGRNRVYSASCKNPVLER